MSIRLIQIRRVTKTTTRLEYQQASHFSIFRNVIKLRKWNFCGLSVTLRNYCVIVELIRNVDELNISPRQFNLDNIRYKKIIFSLFLENMLLS